MSTVLVSNVPNVARQTDTKLVNPVDLAFDKCGKIWVSILTNNLVQQYDRKCGKMLSSVTVTTPTGLDYRCGQLFIASQNGTVYTLGCCDRKDRRDRDSAAVMSSATTTPATYLSVTGGGMLQGLAWHCDLLYITVWDRGYVGVYKDKQAILSIVNDGIVAFSFRPLGIRSLDGRVYITYSDQSMSVGAGYVDVYTPPQERGRGGGHKRGCGTGTLTTLIARDALAYPYGLVSQDDKLLVGNRGTGRIWTYDRETGERVENSNDDVTRSVNDGLMGMRERDGLIYFVAANDNGLMGSLGYIQRE